MRETDSLAWSKLGNAPRCSLTSSRGLKCNNCTKPRPGTEAMRGFRSLVWWCRFVHETYLTTAGHGIWGEPRWILGGAKMDFGGVQDGFWGESRWILGGAKMDFGGGQDGFWGSQDGFWGSQDGFWVTIAGERSRKYHQSHFADDQPEK